MVPNVPLAAKGVQSNREINVNVKEKNIDVKTEINQVRIKVLNNVLVDGDRKISLGLGHFPTILTKKATYVVGVEDVREVQAEDVCEEKALV